MKSLLISIISLVIIFGIPAYIVLPVIFSSLSELPNIISSFSNTFEEKKELKLYEQTIFINEYIEKNKEVLNKEPRDILEVLKNAHIENAKNVTGVIYVNFINDRDKSNKSEKILFSEQKIIEMSGNKYYQVEVDKDSSESTTLNLEKSNIKVNVECISKENKVYFQHKL